MAANNGPLGKRRAPWYPAFPLKSRILERSNGPALAVRMEQDDQPIKQEPEASNDPAQDVHICNGMSAKEWHSILCKRTLQEHPAA
jgi:hypothetical protein